MARTVIAIFETFREASDAAGELSDEHFRPEQVHVGQPTETVGGALLTATADDGPFGRVMEILNRHRPLQLDQHADGPFDPREAALALHVPMFELTQAIDESLGTHDWAAPIAEESAGDDARAASPHSHDVR